MAGVAFVGVGSNIDPLENCMEGLKRILKDERASSCALSSFYTTSPVSPVPQGDFLNCALRIAWQGSPRELLAFLQSVEKERGRTRTVKLGPRTLDLDILLFGDTVMDAPDLVIPHPALHERRFALVPCLEIEPALVHPSLGQPLSAFLDRIRPEQTVTFFCKVSCAQIVQSTMRPEARE